MSGRRPSGRQIFLPGRSQAESATPGQSPSGDKASQRQSVQIDDLCARLVGTVFKLLAREKLGYDISLVDTDSQDYKTVTNSDLDSTFKRLSSCGNELWAEISNISKYQINLMLNISAVTTWTPRCYACPRPWWPSTSWWPPPPTWTSGGWWTSANWGPPSGWAGSSPAGWSRPLLLSTITGKSSKISTLWPPSCLARSRGGSSESEWGGMTRGGSFNI